MPPFLRLVLAAMVLLALPAHCAGSSNRRVLLQTADVLRYRGGRPYRPSPPPGAACPQQNLTSPATPPAVTWHGGFGFATAITADSRTLFVSAPGEQPDAEHAGDLVFYRSKGNVYVAAADRCAARPLVPLQRPPVASGRGQGFGMALAATPDGSAILVGMAGCFVPPGGQGPPPCPVFPGSTTSTSTSSNGRAAASASSAGARGFLTPPVTFWPPGFANSTAGGGGVGAAPVPESPTVEMDLLWLYTRAHQRGHRYASSGDGAAAAAGTGGHASRARPGGGGGGRSLSGYTIDLTASAALKVTGPTLLPNEQTDTFYFTTPTALWPSMSSAADTVALSGIMAHTSKDAQHQPLLLPMGVQVFKKLSSGRKQPSAWSKVLFMRNITQDGQPCAADFDAPCYQWYARQSAISPDGRVLATLWGSPLGPIERDTPISLHWWNPQARRMVLGAWINFTVVTAPSTSPAFSPDSRVLAVGSVRLDAATGAWRSHIELHGLQVVQHSSGSSGYRSSSNGTGSMTAQRLCSMVLPQELDPVTGANAVTDVKLLHVGQGRQVLRLAAVRSAAATLLWDMPLAHGGTFSCPNAGVPTHTVPPVSAFGDPGVSGWAIPGSQAFSAAKVLAGVPGGTSGGAAAAGAGVAALLTL